MSNGCIPLEKLKRVQFAVNPKMPGLMYRTKPCQNTQSLGHGEGRKSWRWRVKIHGTKITKSSIVHWEARGKKKKKKRTNLNNARQCCITGCHTHFWIMGLFLNYFDINILLYHRWDGLTQHLKEENVGEDSGILVLDWEKVHPNEMGNKKYWETSEERRQNVHVPRKGMRHSGLLSVPRISYAKKCWQVFGAQLYHSRVKQVLSEQSKAHNIRERLNNCLMKSGLEECKSSLTEISWTKMSAPDCCYYIAFQEKRTGNHDSIGWGTDWFLHTSIAFITF